MRHLGAAVVFGSNCRWPSPMRLKPGEFLTPALFFPIAQLTHLTQLTPLFFTFHRINRESLGRAEGEIKSSAFTAAGFGPNPAAVAATNPLRARETNASAFVLLGAMQPPEHPEQLDGLPPVAAVSCV